MPTGETAPASAPGSGPTRGYLQDGLRSGVGDNRRFVGPNS